MHKINLLICFGPAKKEQQEMSHENKHTNKQIRGDGP